MKTSLPTSENSTKKQIQDLFKHFSPSTILTYKDCPKLFYYKYIVGIKLPEKKIHLVFGDAFHAGVEELLKTKELKRAGKVYEKTFDKSKVNEDEQKDVEKMLPMGYDMLFEFFNHLPKLDFDYGISDGKSEEWIKAQLTNPFTNEILPLTTIGRIDRLTNSDNIIELKTSKGLWNPEDIKFKIQTAFYSWMFYQNKGRHPNKVAYVIVTKQKTPQVQILEANCTKEDYAKLFAEVKVIFEKIENNVYERPEEFHGKWCDCYKYEEALSTN